MRELDRLVKEMVRIKNQIHTHTDELYPGLRVRVMHSGKQLWIKVLKVSLNPKMLPKLSTEGWQKLLDTQEYRLWSI